MAIFVSYRRNDAEYAVDRIYERLSDCFGNASIFLDSSNIPAGASFGTHILETIPNCRVLLAVISRHWDTPSQSRLRDPCDWVRRELEAARQSKLRVIPVLLGTAEMPCEDELPEPLQWLSSLQAIRVRSGRDFHTDMDMLVEELSASVAAKSDDRGTAADLWEELRNSEDINALERFAKTFNNTCEAYEARGRIKQLGHMLQIREHMEHLSQWSCLDDEVQAEYFFETLGLVDDLLDDDSNTEWHAETEGVREKLDQLAKGPEPYLGFSYDYDQYHDERDLKGRPNRR